MISVRGGSGLGDALYVQSVARYLVEHGNQVEACCNWPDVFRPLVNSVRVTELRRSNVDRLAHYSLGRAVAGTTQWEDCCLAARIPTSTPLRLDWTASRGGLAEKTVKAAAGRPIVLVGLPRAPFGRSDGFGKEVLPDAVAIQAAVDALSRRRVFTVQVGSGKSVYRLDGLSLDMANKTTVSELLDLASMADGFLGFPSFFIPMAESLGKPGLVVWSRRGLNSGHQVIRQITPKKVIHRKGLLSVVHDDDRLDVIAKACDAVLEQIRHPASV